MLPPTALDTPVPPASARASVGPAEPSRGWRLVVALGLLFLLVWLAPPLAAKGGVAVFPLWLHTLVELAAVVVAMLVFAICWHSDASERSGDLLLIGCGFLAVGLLDTAHLLSYKGMPALVTPSSPEKAINFWLAARYVAALTLLAVAWRQWPTPAHHVRARWLMLGMAGAGATAVVLLALHVPSLWPRTFVEGQGLTPFKVAAEYGLVALMGLAAFGFQRRLAATRRFDALPLRNAAVVTVLAELCFTLYSNVNDVFQLLGHAYKIVAYLYIYRAVFLVALRQPYERLRVESGERREAERRIEFLAFHDALTELPNRVLARDRVERAIAAAHRAHGRMALLYLDLDEFKNVNDLLGHGVGDQLLRSVAQRLRRSVRDSDSVCRQSGDEFLVVLADAGDVASIEAVIGKITAALARPLVVDGNDLAISASIGVARFPEDGGDFDTLLQKADTALYRAKDAGRNTWRFFDEAMNQRTRERLQLQAGLRHALEAGQFLLHYQPQLDLRSGRPVGVEALLRWQRPGEGLVPPDRFIPVAEDCGLIVPIGTWVLREACRQAVAWQRQGLAPLPVAVNLSALQFQRGEVERDVAQALAESGLDPALLELELTESIMISSTEQVLGAVQRLKALGVRLSIDDFGTGYSSLSYLKRFAVDKLKIDRSFVRDLGADAEGEAIVRAIVQMAHSLGLLTVAEGVEDEGAAAHLRAYGCDHAQGFLYARPMPAVQVAAFLAAAPLPA